MIGRAQQLVVEKPNLELQRDAARKALFGLAKIHPIPEDWDFINIMHLARHIYKPFSSVLTLGQYADLTRNFSNVVVRRLDDRVQGIVYAYHSVRGKVERNKRN